MISTTVKRRVKKVLLWMEILFILVLGGGVGVVLGMFYQMNKLLPPDRELDSYRPPVATKIYSSDGELLANLASENREPVELEKIPKNMQNAMVAIEDSRFYTHSGLDFRGLVRALWANVTGRELAQGGSTITQQLARNMFLNQRKKISRKIKEILLAVQIERNWTKRHILETYLNQVYFGAGGYGVKAAAKIYFGKDDLNKLTLEECALLAAMPQRPAELNPFTAYEQDGNYDRSKSRRDMVLDRMAELKYITPQQAKIAKARPVKVRRTRPPAVGYFKAKYFVQHVVDELANKYGYDQEYLDKAGFTVITTLDWKMQQAAEKAAKNGLRRYRGWGRVSEAALVCIDPNDGYIRAMVGGVNEPWERYQFNCATQARRQPGSAFKTFVYAAALEKGRSPYTPVAATAHIPMPDGTVYEPKNHGSVRGGLTYVTAFQHSVNGAAVNVGKDVGPANVVAMARRLGITGRLGAYYSIALGTCEVTPIEMASAYGVFAAGGRRAEPTAIIQIRGQEGENVTTVQPRIIDTGLSPDTINGMNVLTQAVVQAGTATAARGVPKARGKTGTTEENTDAWFVGYTPGGLTTAVWAGNRNNKPMSHSLYGGTICAPIWANFMREAVVLNPAGKKRPSLMLQATKPGRRRRRSAPVAATISADGNDRNLVYRNVCTQSGFLSTDNCPGKQRKPYRLGGEPTTICPVHVGGPPSQNKNDKPDEAPASMEDTR